MSFWCKFCPVGCKNEVLMKEHNNKCVKEVRFRALCKFFVFLGVILFGFVIYDVYAIDGALDRCHSYDLEFCDCDSECDGEKVCITSTTPDNIKLMCSASADRINMARKYEGKLGFCAEVFSTVVFPDGTANTRYVTEGSLYCPVKEPSDEEATVNSSEPVVGFSQEDNTIIESGRDIEIGSRFPSISTGMITTLLTTLLLSLCLLLTLIYTFKLKKKLRLAKQVINKQSNTIRMRYE